MPGGSLASICKELSSTRSVLSGREAKWAVEMIELPRLAVLLEWTVSGEFQTERRSITIINVG